MWRRFSDDGAYWLTCAIVFGVFASIVFFAIRSGPKLTEGTIVAKEHKNPSSHLGVSPVFGGKQTQWAITSHADPEEWIFVIDDTYEGERRTERRNVDRYVWEAAKPGDHWYSGAGS